MKPVFFLLLNIAPLLSLAQDTCFFPNTDINGQNLNNGQTNQFGSALECQRFCQNVYPDSALYFTWTIVFVCRDATERKRIGVCAILFEGLSPLKAVRALMERDPKKE